MEIVGEEKTDQRDPVLWDAAKKRYGFRMDLASYVIVISFLWILYFMTGRSDGERDFLPWPVWPTLGWGIGIAFHYVSAYAMVKNRAIEREYQKLVDKDRK